MSAVDSSTGLHIVCRLDIERGRATQLLGRRYIATASISPQADTIFYLAEPQIGRDDLSMHMLDLESGGERLLVRGSVARNCIPSASLTGLVACHTVDGQTLLIQWHTGNVQTAFAGQHPAISPDGTSVLFIREGRLLLWTEQAGRAEPVIDVRAPTDGSVDANLSLSPDGNLALVAEPAGDIARQYAFKVVNLSTKRADRLQVQVQGLRGFCFR